MIYPVVVIYNKECTSSVTFNLLIAHNIKPLVVDNSTIETKNKDICENNNISYISMNGNSGLSKAYNRAIEYLKANTDIKQSDFIMWLDDDSIIEENYFKQLNCLDEYNAEILVPVVRSVQTNKIISPCKLSEKKKFRAVPINNTVDGPIVTGINSGLLVKFSVFNGYRYEEKLFLDYVDHDFFMSNSHRKCEVLRDGVIYQNYSVDEIKNLDSELIRNSIFNKDYRVFAKKWGIPKYLSELRIIKSKIATITKYLKYSKREK